VLEIKSTHARNTLPPTWSTVLPFFFILFFFAVLRVERRTLLKLRQTLFHAPPLSYLPALGFLETGSHYVTQAGLRLKILLPQPPQCWDYKCVPPCPASILFLINLFSLWSGRLIEYFRCRLSFLSVLSPLFSIIAYALEQEHSFREEFSRKRAMATCNECNLNNIVCDLHRQLCSWSSEKLEDKAKKILIK
jgi:hypothetical protein